MKDNDDPKPKRYLTNYKKALLKKYYKALNPNISFLLFMIFNVLGGMFNFFNYKNVLM